MKRLFLKIALFLGLLAAPLVVLFEMPYSKEFAYHFIEGDCYNHGAWIFDRIVRNTTPIDIAFIGSSHTIHGFQERKIEELTGSGDHLVNLGYCRSARNFEYILLKLLLEHKTPKLVIMEVFEDEAKNSHDIFPFLADTRDLLITPTLINRDYFSDVYNGTLARLEYFKANYIFGRKASEPTTELYGYAPNNRTATADELQKNIDAWQRRLSRSEPKMIEKLKIKYPFSYFDKMMKLIEGKNIPLIFVYLPEYGSKLKSPKYAEYYRKFGSLLLPPENIFNDPTNWMDAGHLNDEGSGLLSKWMADELKSELCIRPATDN
jgi:hypothetical protein